VDALYEMMKRIQTNSQAKKAAAKRKDDSNTNTAPLPASKRRKPSLTTPPDLYKQADSKKKSSGSSKGSAGDKARPPVTAASLVAQRTIRSSPTPPPGGSSELPASSLAAQLVLSSSLSAASSLPSSALLAGGSSFSPRAFSRPHWSHEPVSRRNVSGQLVIWPLWVAAHSKAQQLVSQGAVRKAAGGKARAQSRRDEVVYSSDDGDDDSEVSDAEADLPDDDVQPFHPIRPSAFYLPPVSLPQPLLLSLRPDKRDAEIEKMELKLLSKKAVVERETRRPYVDMEGGSRHMLADDPLDKPATSSSSPVTSAAAASIPIPFTKHDGCYICGLCAKSFPDLSKLRRHANTHVDGDRRRMDEKGGVREAAYVCSYPECGKSFLHLNSLRFHERSHKQPPGVPQPPLPQRAVQQRQGGKEEKEVAKVGAGRGVKVEPVVKGEVKRESNG